MTDVAPSLNLLGPCAATRLHDFIVNGLQRMQFAAAHAADGDESPRPMQGNALLVAAGMFKIGIEHAMRFRLPPSGFLLEIDECVLAPDPSRLPYPITLLEWSELTRETDDGMIPVVENVAIIFNNLRAIAESAVGHMMNGVECRIPTEPLVIVAQRIPACFLKSLGCTPEQVEWHFLAKPLILNPGLKLTITKVSNEHHLQISGAAFMTLRGSPYYDDTESFRTWQRPLIVIAQFLAVAQCSNVAIEKLPIDQRFAAARRKRGRVDLSVWHTLDVCLPSSSKNYGHSTNEHASPRFHLRRGHMRHLSPIRTTWVRPHSVGDPARGTVIKDYAVSRTMAG